MFSGPVSKVRNGREAHSESYLNSEGAGLPLTLHVHVLMLTHAPLLGTIPTPIPACSVRLRRALAQRRAYMLDDYAEGLGELRQHLLAHHVRVYDAVQDAGKGFGDTCAVSGLG